MLPQEPAHIRRVAKGLDVKDASRLPAGDGGPEEAACPVLADPAFTASATYGVAFQEFCATGNRPATFVIDRDGVLRWEHRARTNAADRPTPREVLEVVTGLAGRDRSRLGRCGRG